MARLKYFNKQKQNWEYADIAINNTSTEGSGTSNYNDLSNKPKINGVELRGNLTNEQLKVPTIQDVLNALPKWNGGEYNGI